MEETTFVFPKMNQTIFIKKKAINVMTRNTLLTAIQGMLDVYVVFVGYPLEILD